MNTRNAPSHQARKQKHHSAASGQPLPSAIHHRTCQPRQNGCEPIDGALPDSITITPDGSCFTSLLGIQRMHGFSRWRKMIQLWSFHFFLPPPLLLHYLLQLTHHENGNLLRGQRSSLETNSGQWDAHTVTKQSMQRCCSGHNGRFIYFHASLHSSAHSSA